MSQEFMLTIVVPMRLSLGFPFVIPDGGAYRCEEYDEKPNGEHQGEAIDIICNSSMRFAILEWIFEHNFKVKRGEIEARPITRIGINNGSIHIGFRQTKDQRVVWAYY